MTNAYTIQTLPAPERPRERLAQRGAGALSVVELMAIVIGAGTEGRSALDVGRELLAGAHGSLRELAACPLATLTDVRGVGSARAIALMAALELGRRMTAEEQKEGTLIRDGQDIYDAYAPELAHLPVEEFHVGVLDAQHRLVSDILVSRGLRNASLVHAREIFREAIAQNACAVVLVHNHPSGDPAPSPQDRSITGELAAAGIILGIPVVDHVIVGRGRFTSFIKEGILL